MSPNPRVINLHITSYIQYPEPLSIVLGENVALVPQIPHEVVKTTAVDRASLFWFAWKQATSWEVRANQTSNHKGFFVHGEFTSDWFGYVVFVPSTFMAKDPSIQSLISNLVSHFQLWTKCKYAIQSNHVEGKSTPQYKTPYFNGTTSGPNMSKPPFFEYLKFLGCILAQLISCDLGLPQFFSDFLSGIYKTENRTTCSYQNLVFNRTKP